MDCETSTLVMAGQVWRLGPHRLIIADVHDAAGGWHIWKEWLEESITFCPYYGPYLPLTTEAGKGRLLLVHPDPEIARQAINLYASVQGSESVELLAAVHTA